MKRDRRLTPQDTSLVLGWAGALPPDGRELTVNDKSLADTASVKTGSSIRA